MSRVKYTTLPKWLDDIIFKEFNAIYEPHPQDVVYNPDQPYEFVKVYLGTYFPRSYSEAYCILNNLLDNSFYYKKIEFLEEINILDFCCGTGGEIIGLIEILQEKLPCLKRVNIDAFDANPDAIRFLYHLMDSIKSSKAINIEININPQGLFVASEQELQDLINLTNVHYHFILSFKALNEFVQHKTFEDKNVYTLIASYLLPLLSEVGIFVLSDVTTKLNDSASFYPNLLNIGVNSYIKSVNNNYKTFYPYSCYLHEGKCAGCYMQDTISVSHSKKSKDISKVVYRVIAKKSFVDQLMDRDITSICRAVNPSADKNIPYNS